MLPSSRSRQPPYARLLYPDSPHHPRQKYLLTEQGVQLRGQLVRK